MVEAAIRDSGLVLFLASPVSLASIEVGRELDYARRFTKRILPILIADCELPEALASTQFIDWRENQDYVYSEHFNSLKEVILRNMRVIA